ncbi:MAG: NYN domain-containing protein [Acidimicrobiia bacterium]|nr:NYN domain-containing protein [Acidimicrobiia bacterium]MYC57383.1 NYN domain-containing protein [Acidimicrobiia bacterium]MYI31131.1 NYN domain-containing protein [Acidimicrobiia bacterium]
MRVGAYVDGLNLYYGGRHLCGRSTPGWRWLDITKLVELLISRNNTWISQQALVHRIVYCTALIGGIPDAQASQRQKTYLAALEAESQVVVELGNFINRKVKGPDLSTGDIHTLQVPEEKGSDVNVASHLLIDLHTDKIDAAVLITNDSDLRLPAQHARKHLPLGTVNPRGKPTTQALRGQPEDGTGNHWWYSLTANDFRSCQFPKAVGEYQKPANW